MRLQRLLWPLVIWEKAWPTYWWRSSSVLTVSAGSHVSVSTASDLMTPETSGRGRWLDYLMWTQSRMTSALVFILSGTKHLHIALARIESLKNTGGSGRGGGSFVQEIWQFRQQRNETTSARQEGIKDLSNQRLRRCHRRYEIFISCSCDKFQVPKRAKITGEGKMWSCRLWCQHRGALTPCRTTHYISMMQNSKLYMFSIYVRKEQQNKVKGEGGRGSDCWGVWSSGGNELIVSGLIRLPESWSKSHDPARPGHPVFAQTTAIESNETPHCHCSVVRQPWLKPQ